MIRRKTLVALASLGWGVSAWAAPITFENGAADYDNSDPVQTTGFFRDVKDGARIATLTASGNTIVRFTGASDANSSGGTLYDETPGDSTPATHSRFVNERITMDVRHSASGSIGVYARMNDAGTSGYGIVVNFATGADRIRILDSDGTNALTGTIGSILDDNQGVSTLALNTWYTLVATFENLENDTVRITAAIYPQGDTSGDPLFQRTAIDLTDPLLGAGQVGVRFGDNTTGTVTSDFDNFEITPIPEPGTAGLLAAAALCGLGHRRRKRA